MAARGARYKVVLRVKARNEAMEALEFIAEKAGVDTALSWYEGFETATQSLTDFPQRCPLAHEDAAFPDVELRQLIYQSHRIIFTIRRRQVHVLHIRHMSQQDLKRLG